MPRSGSGRGSGSGSAARSGDGRAGAAAREPGQAGHGPGGGPGRFTAMWAELVDPAGFGAAWGLRVAERRSACYNYSWEHGAPRGYHGNSCTGAGFGSAAAQLSAAHVCVAGALFERPRAAAVVRPPARSLR